MARSEPDTWRTRLADAIAKSGRSQRDISLATGRAAGYVNSLLKEGKDPSIDNAVLVCREVGISLSYLLFGYDLSPETEEILALLERNPKARNGILQILKSESET